MVHNRKNVDPGQTFPEMPIRSTTTESSFAPDSPTDRVSRWSLDSATSTTAMLEKQHRLNANQGLTTPTMPEYSPRFYDDLETLDPVKYNPSDNYQEESTMSSATIYDGVVDINPYRGARCTTVDQLIRDFDKDSAKKSYLEDRPLPALPKYQHRQTGMSKSLSENNIQYGRNQAPRRFDEPLHDPRDSDDLWNKVVNWPNPPNLPPPRGRLVNRTPSPVKIMDEIKEDSYIESSEVPSSPTKRSRSPMKQLFGERGFLGRSTSMKELPSEEYRKKGVKHWSEKIKQRVGGMTEDVTKLLPTAIGALHTSPSTKTQPETSTFPVSLNPPAQARIYSEIELMICATANRFLMSQKSQGRLSFESIQRVTQSWYAKNRPQVVELRFDQLTQRDLVLYNLRTLQFCGPSAENPVKLHAMMQSWKSLAKEMSVRTFCTPDSVVRKHMFDCYKILEMLGAPMATFIAFQGIQVKALAIMREGQRWRDNYQSRQFGVEKPWEPENGFGSRFNGRGEVLENPFGDD